MIPATLRRELRAALGLRTTAFSLGQPGSSVLTSRLVLEDVVGSNGSPRIVVLELSPAALNAHHGDTPRALRHYCSLIDLARATPWITTPERAIAASAGAFRGLTTGALLAAAPLYRGSVEARLAEISRHRGATYGSPPEREHPRLTDVPDERRQQLIEQAVRGGRRRYLQRFEIGGAPEAALRAICRLARERDITLVVVDPPVSKGYGRAIDSDDESAEFERFLEGIGPACGMVRATVDAKSLGLTDADFLDATHLHPDGARVYSRWLARQVLAPLLAADGLESSTPGRG